MKTERIKLDDEEVGEEEEEDDDDDGDVSGHVDGMYDPDDFKELQVSSEIR